MFSRLFPGAAALALLFSSAQLQAQATTGIGVTFTGQVFLIDVVNGTTILIGSSGINDLNSLARDPLGDFITATGGTSTQPATLRRVNTQTGALTTVGSIAVQGSVRGLAYDGEGALFVLSDSPGNDKLWRIAPGSTTPVLIGATGFGSLQALCMSPEGRLYAWDVSPNLSTAGKGLIEIDPRTGAGVDPFPAATSFESIQSLAFDSVGRMFAVGSRFFQVNRKDGGLGNAGTHGGLDFRGIEFPDGMTDTDSALGVFTSGGLARINMRTGATISITPSGAPTLLRAIARRPSDGKFFVARTLTGSSSSTLFEYDPLSELFTQLGTFDMGGVVGGLAFDLDDTLLAVLEPFAGNSLNRLVRIDIAAGTFEVIGNLPVSGMRGLAVSPTGVVFGYDAGLGLCVINDSTAGLSDVNPQIPGSNQNSLCFSPRGDLIAARVGTRNVNILNGTEIPGPSLSSGALNSIEFFSGPRSGVPTFYCSGQVNSASCLASLSVDGRAFPSATLGSDFFVRAFKLLPGKSALFFYGTNGRASAPFFGGTLCVAGPQRRTPLTTTTSGVGCQGLLFFDFNAHIASGVDPTLVAGAVVNGQVWSRDSGAPSGTNLTNGIEFEISP